MKQKPIIRLPQIYDAGGDTTKQWFVFFSYRNPKTGLMERIKDASGLKMSLSADERYKAGKILVEKITARLKSGYNPFNDSSVIYPDNLQYQTSIKEYRKAVTQNGTFSFYASKYLDSLALAHEDSTISSYRSKLRIFNAWLQSRYLDSADISALDNKLLEEFFLFIILNQKLSKNTVKKYNQILYNAFQVVCKERKLMQNPVIEMPTTSILNESAPFPIRQNDVEVITKALQSRDPQLLFASKFLFYCSIRPGRELRFMKIIDIDFYRGTINVSASRAKKKLSRIVTIPEHFLDEIRSMKLEKLPSSHYVLSHNSIPGATPLGKNTLRQRWAIIRKELGLPDFYKFYSWKHTGNVFAADAGIPLRQIQLQNGHSSMRTTEIYLKNKAGNLNSEVKNFWPKLM